MKRFASFYLIGLVLFWFSPRAQAQMPSREALRQKIQSQTTKLRDLTQAYLAISPEEQAPFSEFLSQPGTGIVRLLPSEAFNGSQEGLLINGGGAYYSFTRKTYELSQDAEIRLVRGVFSVGFVEDDLGILVSLGETPVSQVTTDSPQTKFLVDYKPPEQGRDSNFSRPVNGGLFSKGLVNEGRTYNRSVPVEVNATYLLRSISYNANSDILVAFQVVKKDFDNSILLIWRKLQEFPKPLRIRPDQIEKSFNSIRVITEKKP